MTRDGKLVHRIAAILRTLVSFGHVSRAVQASDVIMARNLEMLVLGIRAKGGRRLIYECLDIHRLLLGQGVGARVISAIEGWALAKVDLIITSSNRFADDYFRQRRRFTRPILLMENKVLALEGARRRDAASRPPPPGPPWVIGWFGMLRCRRSLAELSRLAAESDGMIKVLIAGIPSEQEFVDFAETVAAAPGLEFVGRYTPADLPALYGRVHFAWAIDYFEDGLNSAWLLPNRLYEAMAHGAVPIALDTVETGNWLRRNGVGITVEDAVAALPALMSKMTAVGLSNHRALIAALPDRLLFTTPDDCIELANAILSND
jgi:glycosyltransferase involved in cell wall biosynthesis